MANFFCPLKPITDFRKLGTGRKRNKVAALNGEGRILFISEVRRNHRCHGEVEFDNRKVFYMDSQSVDGKKVYLSLLSENLQHIWDKQSEVDEIENWMKVAPPQDIFAFLECVGLVREIVTPKMYANTLFTEFAKRKIRQHLEFLSLVELRRLTGLLSDCKKAA